MQLNDDATLQRPSANDLGWWLVRVATIMIGGDISLPNHRICSCVGHGTGVAMTYEKVTSGNVAYKINQL